MRGFITVDRQTDYLLPPSVEDWLPENHLARFIVEVIDRLDLTELTRTYGGRGSAAHHPLVSHDWRDTLAFWIATVRVLRRMSAIVDHTRLCGTRGAHFLELR